MKQLMIMVTVAAAAVFSGCTSVEVTREGNYNDPQRKMTDTSNNPYYIDWDVAKARVEGTGSSSCWFWFFSSSDGRKYAAPFFTLDGGLSAAMDAATFDAAEKADCDALMGCMYTTTKTKKWFGIYKETKADVKGFPANVKSINMIKDRPVLVDKNVQIIRLPNWESL